eukprot:TRINITY_DN6281_c0_g1_i11.p2 TRINITY_DN6281_c0_g1~~TRINITY_DN6281_c0_g1_i11.p2  ORF type:complete len:100 (-),score=24.73 TRINITY_DN6281_c0_g1_i11:218-517(-)
MRLNIIILLCVVFMSYVAEASIFGRVARNLNKGKKASKKEVAKNFAKTIGKYLPRGTLKKIKENPKIMAAGMKRMLGRIGKRMHKVAKDSLRKKAKSKE